MRAAAARGSRRPAAFSEGKEAAGTTPVDCRVIQSMRHCGRSALVAGPAAGLQGCGLGRLSQRRGQQGHVK